MILCEPLKEAACLVLFDGNFNVLTVTRRDSVLLSLPGGKVDPGETPLNAVIRETKEETGIVVDPTMLMPIYANICFGDVDYYTTVFLHRTTVKENNEVWSIEKGINCSFATVRDLIDKGHFSSFNRDLFQTVFKKV